MSNKPAKHSDRKKQWRSSERKSHRVMPAQMTRHLIVCEGCKTEPAYFEAFKNTLNEINSRKVDIRAVGTGLHTTELIEEAQRICRKAPNDYDHVWIAYDKDDFSEEEFNKVVGLCQQSNGATTYHAMWSNPCFELWLLLHFEYTTAPMTTADCLNRITKMWQKAFGRPYKKVIPRFSTHSVRSSMPQKLMPDISLIIIIAWVITARLINVPVLL